VSRRVTPLDADGRFRGRDGFDRERSSVLLVCHANTARSIMAHVLLERLLAGCERGPSISVRSGGIASYARDGMLPSLDARIVLREVGIRLGEDELTSIDLRRHRELVAEAALIITMTAEQREAIARFPEADGRPILTLRQLAGEDGDIGDPAGLGEETFRWCRDEIARCLVASLDRIVAIVSEGGAPAEAGG
jgi:protein arginine phosphatase